MFPIRPSRSLLIVAFILFFSCSFRGKGKAKEEGKEPKVSWEDQVKFGNYMNEIITSRYLIYRDRELERSLNRILDSLVKVAPKTPFHYKVKVLISPEPNSFSAPGGYIYLTTGLLDILNSKCQVAAAMAREIAHIVYGDHVKVYIEEERRKGGSEIFSSLVKMVKSRIPGFNQGARIAIRSMISIVTSKGYSKKMEVRADRFALELLRKAGYDPSCLLEYLKILRDMGTAYTKGGFMCSSRKFLERRIELLEEEL